MNPLLLAAALAAAATPPPEPLSEAAHAIAAGRLDQARLMIGTAVQAGAKGVAIDRLLADLAFELATSDWHRSATRRCSARTAGPGPRRAGRDRRAADRRCDSRGTPARTRDDFTVGLVAGWNARGVAADLRRDWDVPTSHAKAGALNPERAEVANILAGR